MKSEMRHIEHQGSFERKRHPAEMLTGLLAEQARRVNDVVNREYQLENLLKPDATIDPEQFVDLYEANILQGDRRFVRDREIDFSGASSSNVREFYKDEYGITTEDGLLAQWRKNKSREKNGQMEMAITLLLSRKLEENFLVVRTAAYDDYKNGIDNLILDRETGEVVGAFDEVHEGGDGRRTQEKKNKIKKIDEHGGASVRYGLRFLRGKLIRARLENVPVFYLALESAELLELEQGLAEGDSQKMDSVFAKLLASLRNQCLELQKQADTPAFRARLISFGHSLSRLVVTS